MTPARRSTRRPRQLPPNIARKIQITATVLCLFGMVGSVIAAPRPKATKPWPTPKALKIHRFTLDNGLRVVVQPDHAAPVVALGIMVDVGARNETKGRSGLAHFFEHMMFQGSKHVAKMEHFTGLESVGADLNANTSSDRTYYYEVMPKNALELALWFESDRFQHLAINAKNVENQRQTVMEERRQRYDNRPYAASQLKLMQMLFTTWPMQHSVIGSMTDLQKAPLSAFEAFWRTWYTPNNCVLVLVGDIGEAEARALVKKTMGRVNRRSEPKRAKLKDPIRKGHTYATYNEPLGKMPAFHLAFRVPDRTHADAAAIEVLGEVLDGGDASRLSRKLEKESALATRFWAGKYGRRDTDVFHIAVEVSQANAAAVAKTKAVIRDTLYGIAVKGVTAEELQRAKVGLEARHVFRYLSLTARASLLARHETYYGDANGVNKALQRWRAVTAKQVQAAAERWFGWDREVELDVLPKGFAAPANGGIAPRNVLAWQKKLERMRAKAARQRARAAKVAERNAKRKAKRAAAKAKADARKAARKAKADAKKAARKAKAEARKAKADAKKAARKAKADAKKAARKAKADAKKAARKAKADAKKAARKAKADAKKAALKAKNGEVKKAAPTAKPEVKKAAPTAKPEVKKAAPTAKPEVKKAAPTAKPEVKKAATTAKPEVKKAAPTAKPEVKKAATTAKPEVKKAALTAKPEVKKAATTAKPEVKKAATTAKPEVKKAAPTKVATQAKIETKKAAAEKRAKAAGRDAVARAHLAEDTARRKAAENPATLAGAATPTKAQPKGVR